MDNLHALISGKNEVSGQHEVVADRTMAHMDFDSQHWPSSCGIRCTTNIRIRSAKADLNAHTYRSSISLD